ncbi:AAA family ATPase [Methanobrevibacter filiformis]|uniref:AAA domain-containing protein n=1 Tax=Methanobrevibacter filiformis TaxID=55758 RepID=A0A166EVE1_9EURY|nr:AAA family ATPase [Methanobrevibacter filiformis]KZX17056.1 hypothetical protein MBFIL_03900 [Methanobrevibacter filiformis]
MRNMLYIKRISEKELKRKLDASGTVLIRGPKSCGKTESAKQVANSILNVDQDEQVSMMMENAPYHLLLGKTPRLIDEWQEQPKLWNYIRHEIDNRGRPAQFILTGSANPEESIKMHSGAGRFTTLDMRTMSWQELGFSSGKISMKSLFDGSKSTINVLDDQIQLEFIIEKIIIGGFPGLLWLCNN